MLENPINEMSIENIFNKFSTLTIETNETEKELSMITLQSIVRNLTMAILYADKTVYDENIEDVYYPVWLASEKFTVSELNHEDSIVTWLCALIKPVIINKSKVEIEWLNYQYIPRSLYSELMYRAKSSKLDKYTEFALKLAFFIIHAESCDFAVTDGDELRDTVWLRDYFDSFEQIDSTIEDVYVKALLSSNVVTKTKHGQYCYRAKYMGLLTLFQDLDFNKLKAMYFLHRLFPSD